MTQLELTAVIVVSTLFGILIECICGGITAHIGKKKGCHECACFFVGFFLSLIGIIIVASYPNVSKCIQKELAIQNHNGNTNLRQQCDLCKNSVSEILYVEIDDNLGKRIKQVCRACYNKNKCTMRILTESEKIKYLEKL